MNEKNLMRVIEEVCEDICDNYCKYSETVDENFECEVIRSGEGCPLDKLW